MKETKTGPVKKEGISLDTKYRPATFDEVVGNGATVSALRSMVEKGNPSHRVLFIGPRGTGKTTLARIYARTLGVSDMDFRELNTADFRGIDTSRDINQQVRLMPWAGKARFWHLDECHMLTKEAQSALLKVLEEPPEHVYFALSTTDPEKLLPTIKSRCMTLETRFLGDDEVGELLSHVCEKEGIGAGQVSDDILGLIVRQCQGSARNALVLLDKVRSMPADSQAEAVNQAEREEAAAIDLCRALTRKANWQEVAVILRGLDDDPERVRRAILGYCQSVLLNKGDARTWLVMDCFMKPVYDTGKPGLVNACYRACKEP
jgi:DNA polymerase III gamma/tau subunit